MKIKKIISIVYLTLFIGFNQAYSQEKLDLLSLTLNDSSLKKINVEQVTNILGRPSVVNNVESVVEEIGPEIFYHDKGLFFWFLPKKRDINQEAFLITIYLVKKWDDKNLKHFNPFNGVIIPNVDANIKIDKLLNILKDYTPRIVSAQQRRDEWKKFAKDLNLKKIQTSHDVLTITISGYDINFFCEEITKYLEYISIVRKNS